MSYSYAELTTIISYQFSRAMDNHNQLRILPAERWENIILHYFYLGVTGQHELEIYTLAVNVRHKQAATNVIENGLYC